VLFGGWGRLSSVMGGGGVVDVSGNVLMKECVCVV